MSNQSKSGQLPEQKFWLLLGIAFLLFLAFRFGGGAIWGEEAIGRLMIVLLIVIPLSLAFCVNVCGATFRSPTKQPQELTRPTRPAARHPAERR